MNDKGDPFWPEKDDYKFQDRKDDLEDITWGALSIGIGVSIIGSYFYSTEIVNYAIDNFPEFTNRLFELYDNFDIFRIP